MSVNIVVEENGPKQWLITSSCSLPEGFVQKIVVTSIIEAIEPKMHCLEKAETFEIIEKTETPVIPNSNEAQDELPYLEKVQQALEKSIDDVSQAKENIKKYSPEEIQGRLKEKRREYRQRYFEKMTPEAKEEFKKKQRESVHKSYMKRKYPYTY